MSSVTQAYGANAAFIEDLYERYRANPESVSVSWQEFFHDYEPRFAEEFEEDAEEQAAAAVAAPPSAAPTSATPFRSAVPPRRSSPTWRRRSPFRRRPPSATSRSRRWRRTG